LPLPLFFWLSSRRDLLLPFVVAVASQLQLQLQLPLPLPLQLPLQLQLQPQLPLPLQLQPPLPLFFLLSSRRDLLLPFVMAVASSLSDPSARGCPIHRALCDGWKSYTVP
jgi:hypothetical protein